MAKSKRVGKPKEHLIPLARLLQRWLDRADVSGNKFASISGLPQPNIFQILNATHEPNARNMRLLAIGLWRLSSIRYTREKLYELIYPDEGPYPWEYGVGGIEKKPMRNLEPDREGCLLLSAMLKQAMSAKNITPQEIESDPRIALWGDRVEEILTGEVALAPTPDELAGLRLLGIPKPSGGDMSLADLIDLVYLPDPEDDEGRTFPGLHRLSQDD